jgi:hypothetical protein
MIRTRFSLVLFGAALSVLLGCGGSKPIQEEPNVPSTGPGVTPGPQSAPEPALEPPPTPPPNPESPTPPPTEGALPPGPVK